jgi:Raf kinase inhibitor-like YbhB/YbcL family protein
MMNLMSHDIHDEQPIEAQFAFGRLADDAPMELSDNISPHLAWSDVPDGTRSFAILCVDPDVPSVADDVNQPGRVVPAALERVDFYHWVMIDLPADLRELQRGECGRGVTPGGKKQPPGPSGSRQGVNDYTSFMAGDEQMAGEYHGYDGPCPPWNDELLHHYRFTVYALDVERLDVPPSFDGRDAAAAIEGHVLGQASLTGTYTLNPEVG